jgi:hypothetical protein
MSLKADDRYHYRIAQLLEFNETYGTLDVPFHYEEDPQLAKWVQSQRYEYRLLQRESLSCGLKSYLTPHRVELLDSIGFPWKNEDVFYSSSSSSSSPSRTTLSNQKWMDKFQLLVEYKDEFHHVRVPENQVYKGVKLGIWVKHQRTNYKDKNTSIMTPERRDMLNSIGFIWDARRNENTSHNRAWNLRLGQLKDFYERNGHFMIPSKDESFKELATWVKTQRVLYRQYIENSNITYTGGFGPERIKLLNDIGFDWEGFKTLESQRNTTWWCRFEELKRFQHEFGHLDVDQKCFDTDVTYGQRLHESNVNITKLRYWIHTQRTSFRKFHTNGENTTMNQERIKALSSIGFVWNKRTGDWDEMYQRLLDYRQRYGSYNVPVTIPENRTHDKDWAQILELGRWVWSQKVTFQMYKNNEWLYDGTKKCMKLLDGIDFMSDDTQNDVFFDTIFCWDEISTKSFCKQTDKNKIWDKHYKALEEFYVKHGHTMIPSSHDDVALRQWVLQQRRRMATVMMRIDQGRTISTIDSDHLERLKKVNFAFNAHEFKFDCSVKKLEEFRSRYGHTKVTENQDPHLYAFVRRQRELYKSIMSSNEKNSLSPKRIEKLNKIGFIWCPRGADDPK